MVFATWIGSWMKVWRLFGVRSAKMGTIGAPVSRAIRMAPGGRVVGRPKKVTGLPFWKKSRSITNAVHSPRRSAWMAWRTPEGDTSTIVARWAWRRWVTPS